MQGKERRNLIVARLKEATKPISATKLANEFSVTRQIIVADVALLRAAGYPIRAEHLGYVLGNESLGGISRQIVVKHDGENVLDEFYAIVDNGGKVLDVIVEHPLYGTIDVKLNIATRYDAETFVKKTQETGAAPLSLLTEGVHVHTICAPNEESLQRIIDKLTQLNVFIDAN